MVASDEPWIYFDRPNKMKDAWVLVAIGYQKNCSMHSLTHIRQMPLSFQVVQGLRFERRKSTVRPLNNVSAIDNGSAIDNVDADTSLAPATSLLLKHFSRINACLSDMVTNLGDRKSDKAMCEEWELMALVLDRAFLLLYGFLSCLTLLIFIIIFQTQ